MLRNLTVILLSLVAFAAQAAPAPDLPPVDQKAIAAFLADAKEQTYREHSAFEKDLEAALATTSDLKRIAASLASKYEVSAEVMEQLARLWILWGARDELNDTAGKPYPEAEALREKLAGKLRAAFFALLRQSEHARVVIEQIVQVVQDGGSCKAADFDALIAGAADRKRATWIAANASYCEIWWVKAHSILPMNSAMLWLIMSEPYGNIQQKQQLALLEWLQASLAVKALEPVAQAAFRIALARRYIYALWRAGLVEDGVGFYENLPADVRAALLTELQPDATITLDGYEIKFKKYVDTIATDVGSKGEYFRLELANAYYILDRRSDAAKAFADFPYADAARRAAECWNSDTQPAPDRCQGQPSNIYKAWWMLELAIVRPGVDPYDLAEDQFATHFETERSGLWTRFLRKRLDEPGYAALRRQAAERWTLDLSSYSGNDVPETLNKSLPQHMLDRMQHFAQKIGAVRVAMGLPAVEPEHRLGREDRTSQPGPSAYRFAQAKISPRCGGQRTARRLPGTPLPAGYFAVRVEDAGAVKVAISLSQNLDPVGEVSMGGYWVHVSRDGGKTWGEPLYTGLAQYFPYEVVGASCLPLWAGDRLKVAVEINELDRSSITYPPVGLRTKRNETGLYLDMRLAELARDSDGDLITDIEEEHLLLDPKNADTDGDGERDGVDPLPNVANAKGGDFSNNPMRVVLAEIFGTDGPAPIIEGVDKDGAGDALTPPTPTPTAAIVPRLRPIFVQGNPQDFAGFRPTQMMLVYSDADIARLETMTPVFAAVQLDPLTMNRDRTKGFLRWSAGWVGGTIRVVREPSGWRAVTISSWIT